MSLNTKSFKFGIPLIIDSDRIIRVKCKEK
uniref:Uncharacterized protein n=1 Tax=Siphoviridae sp. ctPAi1 TaxID=2826320 RepID=A0A8S5M8U6_9CAUD|nr:MAG TPA: hypothetical protein [Siphoviridae sp. ctPAi1]